jgi:glycosyltransferase involved in cell wall biosynthesis
MSEIKVLFNCSNNVIGGAVQNAANFIRHAVNDDSIQYFYIISKQVEELFHIWNIEKESILTLSSPAKSKAARKKALELESKFKPDIVYTMAGPTYIKFNSYHVMGMSDPYITHSKISSFIHNRSIVDIVNFFTKTAYKAFNARFGADYYIFQTKTSRDGFCRRYWWPKNKTSIVPNAIGQEFFINTEKGKNPSRKGIKIFCPSAYYPHKNLELVLKLAELFKNNENVKFILTIPKKCLLGRKIDAMPSSNIENIGPFQYSEAADLYRQSDIVIMPSLLETFSTSYIEAVAARKPLVVSDTEFSREICGDYGVYYSKKDPYSAFRAINKLMDSGLEVNGDEAIRIISKYGSQAERYYEIQNILVRVFKSINYE